ncbi:MAG: hypothetical protein ABIB93_06980 [Chloroflexota bacterium]
MHSWKYPADYSRRSLDILETALGQLTAYKSWRAFDPGKEYPVDARFVAMPELTKKDIRAHFPGGFVPDGRNVEQGLGSGEIKFVKTGGTTDISVTNIWNQKWWDASEKASWKLNAHLEKIATGSHPEAILVNPMNVGFISDDADLPMAKRRTARFLYLNEKTDPASWTPQLMDRMVQELGIFRPAVLEANPSLLARLCRYIAGSNLKVFQPGAIVFTYEYPTNFHYRQIRRVFHVPIVSSYGSTETGYVFMQCEQGRFHQNSESCRLDFQPLQQEHGGPYLGRVLVTNFNNPWYYIVRFDVGDLFRIEETGRCPCGRDSGIILSAVEGRAQNVTLTCAGRLVSQWEVDDALSVLEGVDEYQLVQTTADSCTLYLVSRRADKDRLREEATEIMKKIYGNGANASVVYEDAITAESSGKYRTTKALFPIEIEKYLDERYVLHQNKNQVGK